MDMMLKVAAAQRYRQFIFLTPQTMYVITDTLLCLYICILNQFDHPDADLLMYRLYINLINEQCKTHLFNSN